MKGKLTVLMITHSWTCWDWRWSSRFSRSTRPSSGFGEHRRRSDRRLFDRPVASAPLWGRFSDRYGRAPPACRPHDLRGCLRHLRVCDHSLASPPLPGRAGVGAGRSVSSRHTSQTPAIRETAPRARLALSRDEPGCCRRSCDRFGTHSLGRQAPALRQRSSACSSAFSPASISASHARRSRPAASTASSTRRVLVPSGA